MTDEQLLDSFHREADGTWTCIKPILFDGPARNLAVLPGTVIKQTDYILGMKIGHELEEAAERSGNFAETRQAFGLKSPIHH